MKKLVLAVSGGVDSVVMLDAVADKLSPGPVTRSAECHPPLSRAKIIVAHFNHGIREDSDEDERFVGELAEKYGFEYEHKKESLGAGASEELARERRYLFLKEVADRCDGVICTAHHADDVIESIVINLIRGTGWRGLVPLGNPDVKRPLLGMFKADILKYANENGLKWREDSTNASMDYLRNRVRRSLQDLVLQDKEEILKLYKEQKVLKGQIDELVKGFMSPDDAYERELFASLDESVALEVLRAALLKVGRATTLPQRREFLQAIKTYQPGKKFNLPGDYLVKFTKKHFKLAKS